MRPRSISPNLDTASLQNPLVCATRTLAATTSTIPFTPSLVAGKYDTMRYRTLEIRWHDSKPISTCDFQPIPFKKARPSQEKNFTSQSYKLATGGEDNHVRVC